MSKGRGRANHTCSHTYSGRSDFGNFLPISSLEIRLKVRREEPCMNRNVIIGIVVVVVIILAVMFLMPGADQPATDATAPATTDTGNAACSPRSVKLNCRSLFPRVAFAAPGVARLHEVRSKCKNLIQRQDPESLSGCLAVLSRRP
jgi:hypothetical protein